MNKRGETKNKVLAAFAKDRSLSSVDLGEQLGLHPAYIRKTLARNGRRLPRKGGQWTAGTLRRREARGAAE